MLVTASSLAIAVTAVVDAVTSRENWAVIWTDTRGGGTLEVSIDGRAAGTLSDYFSVGSPTCASGRGVLTVRLTPGVHTLRAGDAVGRRWQDTVRVARAGCITLRLAPPQAVAGQGVIVADSGARPRPVSDKRPISMVGRGALVEPSEFSHPELGVVR